MRNGQLVMNIEDVITNYIFSCIKNGNQIMYFSDNKQLLINEEVDKWNKLNSIMDNTKRIVGHKTNAKNGEPIYVLHHTDDVTSVIIPMERFVIFPVYEDFMYQLKRDLEIE